MAGYRYDDKPVAGGELRGNDPDPPGHHDLGTGRDSLHQRLHRQGEADEVGRVVRQEPVRRAPEGRG